MLNLRKQTTNILILIGLGMFIFAIAGCSGENALSPTKDTSIDSNDAYFLAPPSQGEHLSHRGGYAMQGNPQLAQNDMMNNGMMGGMMDGRGWGWMGGGGRGWWNFDDSDLIPLTIDQAIEAAQEYLAAINNPVRKLSSKPPLALAEVMEFSNHFYAEVYEKSTGIGAFEILIDLYTGRVYPEPGPNMMWNTKYGHIRWHPRAFKLKWKEPAAMPVTAEKALEKAQEFLDARLPGTKVAEEADTFYGYYTIHVLDEEGNIYGMLSVNAYTGQVWYHGWHGEFVGMKELEE